MAIWGQVEKDTAALHVYSKNNGTFKKSDETLEGFCEHIKYIQTLPIQGVQMQLVALSCFKCANIYVYDIITKDVLKVFSGEPDSKYRRPQSMTHGKPGEIYAIDHPKKFGTKRLKIILLDCKESQFSVKKRENIEIKICHSLVYVPAPHNLLVLTDPYNDEYRYVRAISSDTFDHTWTVSGPIDGQRFQPAWSDLLSGP